MVNISIKVSKTLTSHKYYNGKTFQRKIHEVYKSNPSRSHKTISEAK